MSSLPGVSVFRQRNTGTHPNTHCCHAVLDVLFICWIPAQSRSHAFPRALSLPPKRLPPFLLPAIPTVTHQTPSSHCQDPPAAPAGSWALSLSPPPFLSLGFFSSTPPRISPSMSFLLLFPAYFSTVLLCFPLGFCPYSLFPSPCPHFCLSLSVPPRLSVPDSPCPVFAPRGGADLHLRSPRSTWLPPSCPGCLQALVGSLALFTQPERTP